MVNAALLDAAHQYLKAPIVLIWDNLNVHVSTVIRDLVARRDWLHVIQLPAYCPDLNPTEAVWSHVKRSLGNLATTGVDQLAGVSGHRWSWSAGVGRPRAGLILVLRSLHSGD